MALKSNLVIDAYEGPNADDPRFNYTTPFYREGGTVYLVPTPGTTVYLNRVYTYSPGQFIARLLGGRRARARQPSQFVPVGTVILIERH